VAKQMDEHMQPENMDTHITAVVGDSPMVLSVQDEQSGLAGSACQGASAITGLREAWMGVRCWD
jgi:glucose-6-phosphate-specific signal transduction histidine kinase